MKFTYPRSLEFYHPEYNVGCGGTEVPMSYQGRTYLYVYHVPSRRHDYYCWETDTFFPDHEAPWYHQRSASHWPLVELAYS